MIRIAVVGDIGSGKSHISRQFGYPVFNADAQVAELYKNNRKCFIRLKKAIPDYILSYPIKKNEITNAILSNKSNIKKIIKIVHPLVSSKMNIFIRKNKKKKIIVLDIPLLIENKLNKKDDILIFIDAKKKEINKRLKKRDNVNFKIIKKFRNLQLPVEVKKKKSNFIIRNNFNDNYTKKNVKKVLKKILFND
jgi:dephospho-CoA kinase